MSIHSSILPDYDDATEVYRSNCSILVRVERRQDGATVLLKMVHPGNTDPAAARVLREEFGILRQVAGKGVVAAHRLSPSAVGPLLELEDLGPLTLEQLPEQPIEQVLHIGIQLATILSHVHAKGVLHRDLHPGNVAWNTETGQVTLLDFGAAARVDRHSARGTVAGLGGAFGYWAPEQTGKWTNPIDRRTDLYALGGILYRLITGTAPGPETDVLAAIHAALAVVPLPVDQVRSGVPLPLSRVVTRLLSKVPDDRYQGASGLLSDLLRMRDELRLTGRVTDFELGTKDVPEILILPRRLFGREQAIEQIYAALSAEVNPEQSPIIAVSGPPGIGKSALVAEVAQRVAATGGSLVLGKFDQSSPSPLHGFTHPIGEAVRAVLSLPEGDLLRVRENVRAAIQEAGPEFLDLVPRLRPLIPELSPVARLPPAEARNRTLAALEGLFRALRPAGRPVIIFLDDLQWADAASLDLLERILLSPGARPPLVLGWRSAEVGPEHPLTQLLARVNPDRLLSIDLAPLNTYEIRDLLSRTLACKPEDVSRLAGILAAKSAGNPYFLLQLLETLDERELLRFDPEARQWTWDNAEVEQLVVGDNVATLLAQRLSALPAGSRPVVSVAARCGYHVSLNLLAIALKLPAEEVLQRLGPALVAGHLIENPDGSGVTFAHDRVMRAAVDLLPPETWSQEVGALAARLAAAPTNLDPFVVADRCQEAAQTVRDPETIVHFTRAFIRAAQVARLAGAVDVALSYAEQGAAVLARLPDEAEDTERRRLFFDLYFEGARASAACPERSPEPDFIEVLLRRTNKQAARSRVHALKIQRHRGRWEHEAALDDTVVALAELGLRLPRHPSTAYAAYRIGSTILTLWRRGDAALDQLPVATETEVQIAQEILLSSVSAAYITSPNLLTLMISGSIDLALGRGTGSPTAWAFSTFAFIEAVIRGRLERGVHFGRLARETLRRSGGGQFACRVELNVVGFVESLQMRLAEIPDKFERICQAGIADGDWEYAVLSANNVVMFGIGTARSLDELSDTAERLVATCADLGHRRHFADLRIHAQMIEDLRDTHEDAGLLSGRYFKVEELDPLCRDLRDSSLKGSLHNSRTVAYAHLGEFEKALAAADEMEPYLAGLPGAPAQYWHHLYAGIARAWMARTHAARPKLLASAQKSLRELERLAKISPHNHQHRVVILGAMLAAVRGDLSGGLQQLERGAGLAAEGDFSADGAMAVQMATRLCLEGGLPRAGAGYLEEALVRYGRWGARGVVRRLRALGGDPEHREQLPATAPRGMLSPEYQALLVASRAISEVTSLEDLLRTIVTVLVEGVGARRGILVMPDDGLLRVVATGETEGSQVAVTVHGLERARAVQDVLGDLAHHVIYVSRTRKSFIKDEPRSILVVPLLKGDVLYGVVYLDNEVLPGAFGPWRLELAGILAAQAAIAIQNARLVDDLRQSLEMQRSIATSFHRFVPDRLIGLLDRESILDVLPGDQVSRRFTVLFADVRGFTGIAEQLPPELTFYFINQYLSQVQPAIDNNGGIISQFLGDGIMALFPEDSDAAVAGAVAMFEGVRAYNQLREARLPEVRIGIGLNSGMLALGTRGVPERLDCGVVGDPVNIASRVEGLTKYYGAPLIISETTYTTLKDPQRWTMRELDLVVPAGRKQPLRVYEVLDAENNPLRQEKIATLPTFRAARAALSAGRFDDALAGFSACVRACPGDSAAALLAQRCAQLREEGAAGWDGVWRPRAK